MNYIKNNRYFTAIILLIAVFFSFNVLIAFAEEAPSEPSVQIVIPTISTLTSGVGGSEIGFVTQTETIMCGRVESTGGEALTATGIIYDTNEGFSNPTTLTDVFNLDEQLFCSLAANLTPNTKYYIKAYGTNGAGTGYGQVTSFITTIVPVVITSSATTTSPTTATLNAETVYLPNNFDSIEHGFEYGLSEDLSSIVETLKLGSQTDIGEFTKDISGLTPSTTYYYRAYSQNNSGIGYGDIESFTSLDIASSSEPEVVVNPEPAPVEEPARHTTSGSRRSSTVSVVAPVKVEEVKVKTVAPVIAPVIAPAVVEIVAPEASVTPVVVIEDTTSDNIVASSSAIVEKNGRNYFMALTLDAFNYFLNLFR